MKKFLLIGSAPYIKDWYKEHGKIFLNAGYELVAMNNAWAVAEDDVDRWIHGNDFMSGVGRLFPAQVMRNMWNEIETDDKYPDEPYTYEYKGSGTTILNAICYLLNISVADAERCTVAIAGADCMYNKDKNHFYGNGSPDPIRFGRDWLIGELNRLYSYYQAEGCEIYNVGGQLETLLPFTAKNPKELANEKSTADIPRSNE